MRDHNCKVNHLGNINLSAMMQDIEIKMGFNVGWVSANCGVRYPCTVCFKCHFSMYCCID